MLHLAIALTCLLGAATSQSTFYCNSTGVDRITDRDFYLVTRRQGEVSYPRDLRCNFSISTNNSNSAVLFLEILEADIPNAHLTIKALGISILRTAYLFETQLNLMTKNGSLQVEFESARFGSSRNASGVRMRVRAVQKTDCPPGWHQLNGTCFGTGTRRGRLSFDDAQKACNNVQSNLLHLPSQFSGDLGDLMRQLPSNLTANYSWIGLTNIYPRSSHLWLNGNRLYKGATIGCIGSSFCGSSARCAAAIYPSDRTVYKAECSNRLPYICHMPPGGADALYSVPREPLPPGPDGGGSGGGSGGGFQWWHVPAGLFCCVVVVCLLCYGGTRKKVRIVGVIYE